MQRALTGLAMSLPVIAHAHVGDHGQEGPFAGLLHFLSSPDHALLALGAVTAVVVAGLLITRKGA